MMEKQVITTLKAPAPIGPYSQAIQFGSILFISGQIAIDPISNSIVASDIKSETAQVMQNLQAILAEAGMDFNRVVKTTIYLSDMVYFPEMNEVYGTYFDGDYPARETIAVKELPRNVHIEISMIAAR